MMKMESSYGGIALGANRCQKMTMVVHEKRRSRGEGLKWDNRELEGSHTVPISELRGDFRTNSHSRRDSAFAYEESLQESPLRMMERLQEKTGVPIPENLQGLQQKPERHTDVIAKENMLQYVLEKGERL